MSDRCSSFCGATSAAVTSTTSTRRPGSASHARRRAFDPRRRFSTWLFQIAVNLCRDWHRRPPPEPHDPDTLDGVAPDAHARSGAALDAERLLAALPEPQRAAVLLRYYHDLPKTRSRTSSMFLEAP
jgi:hypothetical protein